MIEAIKNSKGTVEDILNTCKEARDNDFLLILKVWTKQNPNLLSKDMSFIDFGIEFRKGSYTHTETIRRNRQLLQAKHPELRGISYKSRHEAAEEVRININN